MTVTDTQKQYLAAMGIPVWERRRSAVEIIADDAATASLSAGQRLPAAEKNVAEPVMFYGRNTDTVAPTPHGVIDYSSWDWPELQAAVKACQACELANTRTQTVFGVGDPQARLLVIGEAPGADEDRQGEPFVGRAGQLLNEMLWAIGFQREQVYIANILKCRPPNNRDPKPEEMVKCSGFLQRQIELVQPKVILAVGRISAQHLTQSDQTIGRLRGHVHRYGVNKIPLIATYHPAYLLRSPLEKRRAWDDLLLALNTIRAMV